MYIIENIESYNYPTAYRMKIYVEFNLTFWPWMIDFMKINISEFSFFSDKLWLESL